MPPKNDLSNDREIDVEVEYARINGDTFDTFTDIFYTPSEDIYHHQIATAVYMILGLITFALFLNEFLYFVAGDLVVAYYPLYDSASEMTHFPFSVLGGFLALIMAFPFYNYANSKDVDPGLRPLYYLASSVRNFQNKEYEDCVEDLGDSVGSARAGSDQIFHGKRISQLKDYHTHLREAQNRGELETEIKETFREVIEPICTETIIYVSSDEPVSRVLGQMGYEEESRNPVVEVFVESFKLIEFPNPIKIGVILALALVSLAFGVVMGSSWAIVPLSLYLVYSNIEITESSESSN